jgi:hypothetical protein
MRDSKSRNIPGKHPAGVCAMVKTAIQFRISQMPKAKGYLLGNEPPVSPRRLTGMGAERRVIFQSRIGLSKFCVNTCPPDDILWINPVIPAGVITPV